MVRRSAFGWRSQAAITRIKEAVAEIKKVAKKDPVLATEGAVLFLEKIQHPNHDYKMTKFTLQPAYLLGLYQFYTIIVPNFLQ